jgi:hypothetical protein
MVELIELEMKLLKLANRRCARQCAGTVFPSETSARVTVEEGGVVIEGAVFNGSCHIVL